MVSITHNDQTDILLPSGWFTTKREPGLVCTGRGHDPIETVEWLVLQITGTLHGAVHMVSWLQTQLISVDRVKEYSQMKVEVGHCFC